ncbi:CFA53 protein, partial [Atrichornis clamosus]|nr:CFA53 protein [Atrichornis clamosus]
IAKPAKRNVTEELILADREREEARRAQTRALRVFHHYRNAGDWHKSREHKWVHRAAERRVQAAVQEYLEEIDVRRDRLREFLEAEESRYFAEVEAFEKMAQDKEAKMKEQTKLLREKREKERQQMVAEKREQQFRIRCDEFRLHCSKRLAKELGDCQLAQQALKKELKKAEEMEERKLEEICEKELLAKDQEEELKAQEVAARIQDMLNALGAQVAVHSARKEEAKQLIKEEAEWLEEELHQFRKENEELERQKRHKQKECRETWLSAVRDKQNHRDEEKQSELAVEKMILEKNLPDPQKDAEEKTKKKRELLKEQLAYLAHLGEQLEKDKERERQDEKLFKEERDQVWAEKVEKMKLEREARFQLLRDVVKTREMQMEEKLRKKAERQIEIAEEKKSMAEAVREFKREEEEKRARKVQKAKEYREQLTSQIAFQQWLHNAEAEERKREHESNMEAERKYQERIQFILSTPLESVIKAPTT